MIYLVITCALWVLQTNAQGCSSTAVEERSVIANKIYACSGTFSAPYGVYGVGANSAGALCGTGYSVCSSAQEAQDLGLTDAICDGVARTSIEYFATQETSDGHGNCYSFRGGNPATGYFNDIWGCGGSSYSQGFPCGPTDYWIGQGPKNDWAITTANVDGNNWSLMEAKAYTLTNARSGGVLCCVDDPCAAAGASMDPGHRCRCSSTRCDGEFCRDIAVIPASIGGGVTNVCPTGQTCCCSCGDCPGFSDYL